MDGSPHKDFLPITNKILTVIKNVFFGVIFDCKTRRIIEFAVSSELLSRQTNKF